MRPVLLAPMALLALAVSGRAQATPESPAERAGKARLVEKLQAGIRDDQKRIDELRAFPGKGGKLPTPVQGPFAIDPEELRRNVLDDAMRRQGAWRAFLGVVEQEEADRVPARLRALYLSCGPRGCRDGLTLPDVEDFVAAFGLPALQALLDGFGDLDAAKKESVLNLLLRVDPPLCPNAVLDRALSDPVFRVRAAALGACRRNCAPGAFQKSLETLLARESDPEFLLYLLELVAGESGRNAWRYDALIRLVQDGRIPAGKAFGQLCSASLSGQKPDAATGRPVLAGTSSRPPRRGEPAWSRTCFSRLDQERHLVQLGRLLTEAAEHRYGFGSVRGLYGPASPRASSYWDSIPGSGRSDAGRVPGGPRPAVDARLGERTARPRSG